MIAARWLMTGLSIGLPMWGLMPSAVADPPTAAEQAFVELRDTYLEKYRPLWLAQSAAWWDANVSGSDADFARKAEADRALVDLHADRATFARLKALRDGGQVREPRLRRELDVMYRNYLPGQADPGLQKRIVALENEVEQIFNTFRPQVDGRTLTENDVRETLRTTSESAAAEAAWKAYMAVGRAADGKLRELVRLRNELARELGFANFYALNLMLQEVDEDELIGLFDELDRLTAPAFAALKQRLDREQAARFRVAVDELRPWHFGDLFFQEAPAAAEVDFDALFRDMKLEDVAARYYGGIGLPVTDILARSDLYEKPGKCPHAFCHDMDRAGDIRILCNLEPNLYWANTLLHELGHAVYDKYIRPDVPFLLRTASHGITTEGIAELFGALVKNEDWLRTVAGVPEAEAARVGTAARDSLRTERLMFARWAQVMVRFERSMYRDPDQDLARLWWELKARYQGLNPPDRLDQPDYAAKVHVLTSPVYYHSYLLGELFAAQVRHALARDVLRECGPAAPGRDPDTAAGGGATGTGEAAVAKSPSYAGRPEVGAWLKERVFGPGNTLNWQELTQHATGESLTPKYFVAEVEQR